MFKPKSIIDHDALLHSTIKALNSMKMYLLSPGNLTTIPGSIFVGGFGDVEQADLRVSLFGFAKRVAVKRLRPAGERDSRVRIMASLARELKVWIKLRHKNILQLQGFYYDEADLTAAWIATHWQPRGNLRQYLRDMNPDQQTRLRLAEDTVEGLAYLHHLLPPVCHGDLKPENTLIDEDGNALLCDFGLSKIIDENPSGLTTTKTTMLTTRYAAPELFDQDSTHTLMSDMWAWGCLLLTIMSDRFPYSSYANEFSLLRAITVDQKLPSDLTDVNLSDDIRALLVACWDRSPASRVRVETCCATLRQQRNHITDGMIVMAEDEDEPSLTHHLPGPSMIARYIKENPAYVSSLHALLLQSTAPDTKLIKSATASLDKNYYRDPNCIPALFEILASAPEWNIRQLAGVELRKRISQSDGRLWIELAPEFKQPIKAWIFECILSERISIVRHSTARVVSPIADLELPNNTWPELVPFIQKATSSSTAMHHEVGAYVLLSILESDRAVLVQETSSLLNMLSILLQETESPNVRVTAVRALGTLVPYIGADDVQEIHIFQNLVRSLLHVAGEACQANNEEGARHAFDVVESLLVSETPLLAKHVPELLQLCLHVGANNATDNTIRVFALNVLSWAIKYKRSKIQAQNLAKAILDVIIPIGSEPIPDDLDEDSPSRVALRAIDALAAHLPPQQVFPPLHALVSQYMHYPDPGLRKAAIMSFGVAVEGCRDYVRPHMKNLWPLIDGGLSDPVSTVRNAACLALGCVCEWFGEECAERHSILLPVIISLTEDPDTQRPACVALDSYLEVLGDKIGQYLPIISQQVGKLLAGAPLNVKGVVTGALGSAAHAAQADFIPYFEESMERLRPFLSYTNGKEERHLRGLSMSAIGTMAEVVGKDLFRPYAAEMMKIAFEGVRFGSGLLRESSFHFFGMVAKVFGEEFAPFLGRVVPLVMESLTATERDSGVSSAVIVGERHQGASTQASTNDDCEMTDAIAEVDPKSSSTDAAIEKEISATTLGAIFGATQRHFLPYLSDCALALVRGLDHYYEGVRTHCINTLFEFIRTLYDLSAPPSWQPGFPEAAPLDDHIVQLLNSTFVPVIKMWESEDDKSVVTALCQELAETLPKVGPGMLLGTLEKLCQNVQQILAGKSRCQHDPDAEESEEAPDEQAEADSFLISAAGDVVASLAVALGPNFVQIFGVLLPHILKYASETHSSADRVAAVGTLGEVVTNLGKAITQFTEPILQATCPTLSDENPEVRSNAAFTIGVLIENSDADLGAHYMHILNTLEPMFEVSHDSGSAERRGRDNAVGAVSRMILKNARVLPLQQILPVLYGALPLQEDYLENTPLYRSILYLFQTDPGDMMNYLDVLLSSFSQVLSPPEEQLTADLRGELLQLVRHLYEQVPDKVVLYGLADLVA